MSAPSAAQPVDHARDAVGLLHAKLGRAAHDRLPFREAAQEGDKRQLVDRERDLAGLDHRGLQRRLRDVDLADRLVRGDAVRRLLELAHDHPAHALGDAEERGPGPVERHAVEHDPRARDDQRGRREERGRTRVARHHDVVELELVGGGHVQRAALAREWCPRAGQDALGVVAALGRLGEGRLALGQQSRDKEARLDLRACHRQLVVDPGECRPADGERREASLARLEVRRPSAAAAPRRGRPGGGGSTRRRRGSSGRRPDPRASPAGSAGASPRCPRRAGRRWWAPQSPGPRRARAPSGRPQPRRNRSHRPRWSARAPQPRRARGSCRAWRACPRRPGSCGS